MDYFFASETSAVAPMAGGQRRRRRQFSARHFVLTICLLSALTFASVLLDQVAQGRQTHRLNALVRRDLTASTEDLECRLVHGAKDKCAFVKANCPDEQAGIFPYLNLYYCALPHAKPVAFTILILWLGLLFSTIGIAASDFFCVNLSTIATLLGMSESMAGVTFLAFGNGSPDVFSTFAAMSTNSGSLAIGELIGAASFITAVVAGSMALVRPFKVARKSFIRDVVFFLVAASFSMLFLYDGKLYLWECLTMVGFYVFYVCFVLLWHWWLSRRKRRLQKEAAMRGHFVLPGGEEAEPPQEYHDDEDADVQSRPPLSRGPSADDMSTLERGGSIRTLDDIDPDGDEEDEYRERWMGELSSNMRLSRPAPHERRHTHVPIRPSLVGALEFRAVLSSLKKSRNIQTMPLNLRRYSDDPNFTTAQQQDALSIVSDPQSRPSYQVSESGDHLSVRPSLDPTAAGGVRSRAISASGVDGLRVDHEQLQRDAAARKVDLLGPLPEESQRAWSQRSGRSSLRDLSPAISVTPPPSDWGSRAPSPAGRTRRARGASRGSGDLLAPPGAEQAQRSTSSDAIRHEFEEGPHPENRDVHTLPKLDIPDSSKQSPKSPLSPLPLDQARSPRPGSRPMSPLVHPSMRPPSMSDASPFLARDSYFDDATREAKPWKWWPYKLLPPPRLLGATLFPTLYSWTDKNAWERCLAVVAAPSVFLLTVTLPVVESESQEDSDATRVPDLSLASTQIPVEEGMDSATFGSITILEPEEPAKPSNHPHSATTKGRSLSGNSTTQARDASHPSVQLHQQPPLFSPGAPRMLDSPEQLPADVTNSSSPNEWNRWLVILQAFTAPFFMAIIIWANMWPDQPSALLRPFLIALLVSLVLLALILGFTTPTKPPRWRRVFCFIGFAVAIAWISTIANEVVGVLKTIGVVLNISDAILGLTIFAVGNSLGDLVADITVARLGYPVMALSACFGGPMLNILLGVGVSGCYLTIRGAQKRRHKHPDKDMKFKPFHIDVSPTLFISGATLLFTLIVLLIAVPARKWRMDRVIGWGLVILWTLSTIGNVVAEIVGIDGHTDMMKLLTVLR